jgi:tetratricopeptide (TPR) repeat protein
VSGADTGGGFSGVSRWISDAMPTKQELLMAVNPQAAQKVSEATKYYDQAETIFHAHTTSPKSDKKVKMAEALSLYQKAYQTAPVDSRLAAWSMTMVGLCHDHLSDNKAAIEAYQRSVEMFPNSPGTYFYLGEAYQNSGQQEDAIAAYKKCIAFCLNRGANVFPYSHARNALIELGLSPGKIDVIAQKSSTDAWQGMLLSNYQVKDGMGMVDLETGQHQWPTPWSPLFMTSGGSISDAIKKFSKTYPSWKKGENYLLYEYKAGNPRLVIINDLRYFDPAKAPLNDFDPAKVPMHSEISSMHAISKTVSKKNPDRFTITAPDGQVYEFEVREAIDIMCYVRFQPVAVMQAESDSKAGNMLYGTVVDTEGDPVRGALVLPLPHGGDPVVTDDEGKFRLAGPSQDPNVDRRIDCLLVRDIPTNQAAIVKLESVKGPMRIRLQEALSVFGQVTDVDGSPVSDAKVDLSIHSTGWTAGFGNTNFNRTDSKGCFEIPALPHEFEYILHANADDFQRFERRLGQSPKPGRAELEIEARFLLVPDNFLEDIGLDVSGSTVDGVTSKGLGEIVVGPANSEEILAALEHKPLGERNDPPLETPGKVFTTLDERQCDFIIGARYAHRNSKTITAPKVMVLNGESACLQVVRDQRYTVGPEEFLDTETGMTFDIMPEISEDKKTVVLRGHIQLSDITETKTKTVAGQDYEMPVMQVTNIPIHQYALNDQQTLLIKGPEMTISKETHEESDVPIINQIFSSRSKVTDKQRLLIMIKPTVIEPQEVEPKPAIGVLAPESNNGHSGGMGGGFGGGFRPNNN